MKDELFKDLLASVREAEAIRGGEQPSSRTFVYSGKVLLEVREKGKTVWALDRAAAKLRNQRRSGRPEQSPADPRVIREALGQTQEGFAELLGVSVKTLQNWEQGRRDPVGPARRLLDVALLHPLEVLDAAGTFT